MEVKMTLLLVLKIKMTFLLVLEVNFKVVSRFWVEILSLLNLTKTSYVCGLE